MTITPTIDQGYRLLHDGVLALAAIEGTGMRVDVEYLDNAIEETAGRIKRLRAKLMEHKVGKLWRKRFGTSFNLDSRDQLGELLYDVLGYECKERTATGKPSTDETALEALNVGFVRGYLKMAKLEKALTTYLKGIRREVVGDRLHPVFNLHTVTTYRSSSDTPNFQNMPIRNKEMGKLIRQAFIASPGHVIVENDFKGVEVSIAACYHKDPVMISYIKDETKDMHRDMAMEIYKLEKEHVSKEIRHASKNKFVFPQFYGDWYLSCAKALWEEIDRSKLKGPDGASLRDHLIASGIRKLGSTEKNEEGKYPKPAPGTFIKHLQAVENHFWNDRFKVYGKWKERWFKSYLENGYFDTLTGFRVAGVMGRNEVINYPVQGSAFHCLLWSLIRLNRELRKRKMKSRVVGQIHDSIVADVAIEELDTYLEIVRRITMDDIQRDYTWIVVPLVIECEISPEGGTWFDKQEVKMTPEGFMTKDGAYKGSARGLIKFWNEQKKEQAA